MFTLDELAETIAERAEASAKPSYTRSLLDKGAAHCARKFGEEAIELAIAAAAEDENAVRAEAADVLYHLLVVLPLAACRVRLRVSELEGRTRRSGHEEKASRKGLTSQAARAPRGCQMDREVIDHALESPFGASPATNGRKLRADTQLTLTIDDLRKLQSTHDPISLDEVVAIYLPLSRLLALYVAATQGLFKATQRFLGATDGKVPYIIGVAGSVAVGKSTTARVLQALLTRWPNTPKVQLVTTDGFLHPNAELIRQGIMDRKGFPESYDGTALIRFLSAVKAGRAQRRRAGLFAPHLRHRAGRNRSSSIGPTSSSSRASTCCCRTGCRATARRSRSSPTSSTSRCSCDADDELAGAMVHRAFHAAAPNGVPRSAQLFPPIRRSRRRGSGGDRALDLAAHQSCQPAREYPADATARRPAADQGREPPHRGSGAAETVMTATRVLAFCARRVALSRSCRGRRRSRARQPAQGKDLTQVAGLAAARAKRADDLVNADGIFWRIEKPGLAPSYLLRHNSFDRRLGHGVGPAGGGTNIGREGRRDRTWPPRRGGAGRHSGAGPGAGARP